MDKHPGWRRSGTTASTATPHLDDKLERSNGSNRLVLVELRRGDGLGEVAETVGGGADLRLTGTLQAAEPQRQPVHVHERGDPEGQLA